MGKAAGAQAVSPSHFRPPHTGARRWLRLGLDLVYPPVCARCQETIEPGSPASLCAACRAALVDARPGCPRCGALLPADSQPCPRCRDARLHFDSVWRLGPYQGALRSAVLRTKHSSEGALAAALGELLAETAGGALAALALDVVVPVPMHWTRKMWRGANSPDVVAGRLAGHLGVPSRGDLLRRCRRTAPQASLSPAGRAANVRGAFRAKPHWDLPGARVLLVDDIMTTGATANEAAKTLSKVGAALVVVAVLARAEGPA
ncbi:MAG: double zinc ribbon domain-containing protein [Pirellulales bacterium]